MILSPAIANRAQRLILCATMALSPALALSLTMVTGSATIVAADSNSAVMVGIDGHCRIGHWTRVQYSGPESCSAIETRDGDGVRVVYHQGPDAASGYVIPGSEAAPLVLRDQDQEILSTRFPTVGSPGRGPAMIVREMRWVVVLGDPLGIDSIGANRLLDRDAKIAVTNPTESTSLPDASLGYDGVDMIMINASGIELLRQLSDQQQAALRGWILDGGFVFLTLGQQTEALQTAVPWLMELIPLDQAEVVDFNPSALETFTSTQTPLDPFRGVKLPKDQGRPIIRGRTMSRVSAPLAAEYNAGFGRIVVLVADLEQEMFANWPERLSLITQLTGSMLVPESTVESAGNRATAYDDLAGQLRGTLDQFQSQRDFGFSLVSLVLIALIALIGPLDYLLINRVLGKPLLGWVSFPLIVIGICAVLVMQSERPPSAGGLVPGDDTATPISQRSESIADVETNQLEIFDVDTIASTGRGFSVRYFYTHDARRMNVDVVADAGLDSISNQVQSLLTAPFGYPGPAFGGIPISIEDTRLPKFDLQFRSSGSLTSSRLVGLPVASRSSKGVFSRCRFLPELPVVPGLARRPGSELLTGALDNPLPFDLFDGVLVFRNWAYLLPTRFPAGGQIRSVDELRQKNFRWRMSRQQALEESETQIESWDPTDTDSLNRVAEMLMFHDAVGGTRYTNLRSDPLSNLDLTNVLSNDRCMLIGRIGQPLTSCRITSNSFEPSEPVSQSLGRSLTLIRVVLPVNDRRRR